MSTNDADPKDNCKESPNWGSLSHDDELWIQQRFEWLIATFGIQRLWQSAFVTPRERDFPDPYSGTEADATVLFTRICGYLDLDVNRIMLGFFSSDDPLECELAGLPSNAAGLYQYDQEKPRIWLDRSQLQDAESLVATIAHELCHEILLGGGHIDPEVDQDDEDVTDLLTVFLGFGVFSANSCVREKTWSDGHHQYTENRTSGYLTMAEFAHALAWSAWCRNEIAPEWFKSLRPDARDLCRRGLERLTADRGMPHQIPSSLKSPIADRIRQTPRDRLDLPELIVPDSYETDQYAGVVNCVCPDCHDRISFPIDLAGLTASCPQCGGYVDVPELAGGRRETLVSQWNNRARLTAGDDPWKKHNLPGRWRLYSVSIALLMATGLVLGSNRIISPEILAAIMFGGLLGIFFTRWWIELKSLERGIPSLLKSSDD